MIEYGPRRALIKEIDESHRSDWAKRRRLARVEQELTRRLANDPVARQLAEAARSGKLYMERDVADAADATAVLEYREAQRGRNKQ